MLRISAGFFSFLFGGLFFKLLTKIYYKIFRLRKDDLTSRAAQEIAGNHLVYILLFTFTFGFISLGLVKQNEVGAAGDDLSKTVMAQLIQADSEFLLPQEELVEETLSLETLKAAGNERYLNDRATIAKVSGEAAIETGADERRLFDENGDLVFKPVGADRRPTGPDGDQPTQRTEIVEYVVQNGDTVSSIARRFGISVNTILWANDLNAYSLIRPGDSLTILPYSGILYTVKSGDNLSRISTLYSIDMEKITQANNLDGGLKAGQKIILPGAARLAPVVAAKKPAASYTGISAIRDFIQAPAAKPSGSSKMVWPTVGSRITQYFSWRHTGIDIANKIGTPLYAADDGVVEIAAGGYNGGYGNTIVINHGGGIKTRYGHASKLFVKVGDQVEKGENIAAMGSTGRSTGSHLHFEVLVNGARKNPLNYVR